MKMHFTTSFTKTVHCLVVLDKKATRDEHYDQKVSTLSDGTG
jgi:hypothetical protein